MIITPCIQNWIYYSLPHLSCPSYDYIPDPTNILNTVSCNGYTFILMKGNQPPEIFYFNPTYDGSSTAINITMMTEDMCVRTIPPKFEFTAKSYIIVVGEKWIEENMPMDVREQYYVERLLK